VLRDDLDSVPAVVGLNQQDSPQELMDHLIGAGQQPLRNR
jgi:hypothetical protein